MSEEGRGEREEVVRPATSRRVGRVGRVITAVASSLTILILVVLIAVLALTSTDWGRERVRVFAEGRLKSIVHGNVRIGKIEGNLLTGIVVRNLVITDTAGKPFIAVSAIRGDYGVWDLLHKRILIKNAIVYKPLIVLDRPPNGGVWNYKRIFPRDTMPKPAREQTDWGDWIRFTDLRVVEGDLVVRTPWNPSRRLSTAAARDSAIRAVMSGESRLLVERFPTGGFQKVASLRSVTATIPLLRISEPDERFRLARVATLEMSAFPFRPPAAEVVDLKGDFTFDDDSVWWNDARAKMPATDARGSGSYVFKTGDMTVIARAGPASSTDMRWVYPRLPANGHGSVDFQVTWRGPVEDYVARNMDFALGNARVRGSFGVEHGDSVRYHDSDLRFSNIDTRLLEQLIPGLESPRRGTLNGRAAFHGGRNALVVDGDVSFSDSRGAGTSRVVALGEVGFPGDGVRARNLRLQLRPFQVELVRTWAPKLPISGVVTGAMTVNGWTGGGGELRIAADLDHRDRGTLSAVNGTVLAKESGGRGIRGIQRWRFDADLRAHPVSLVEVGRFFPKVGLQGTASGPIRAKGTLASFDIDADLRLVDGGQLAARGHLALTGRVPAYDITAGLQTFNLRSVLAKAPETALTARAAIKGSGTELATMRTTLAADLSTSRWDSVAVDTASIRATIANGRIDIARLDARGGHATASARGSFGLTRSQTGTLAYNVAIDSLAAFNRFIPGATADSTPVRPRPGLVANAMRVARADSTRIAKRTEVERFVTGRAPPRLAVTLPRTVRRDTLGGVAYAAGTISGNLYDFDLRGRAGGEDLSIRGSYARHFSSEYAWTGARTPGSRFTLGIDADSVMAVGFALDTVNVRVAYTNPNGHADILVRQGGSHDYAVAGDFTLASSGNEVRIARMTARLDTALWRTPHSASVRWGGPGIEIVNLELVNRSNGRIYANGLLPTEGVANFEFAVDNLPAVDIVDLLQSDLELTGAITLAGAMRGTLSNPTFRGAFAIADGTYRGTTLPQLRGRFGYAGQELQTHVDAFRNTGAPMASLDGKIGINLAFSGVTGKRLLDDAMSIDIVADSLPLELIPHFTDAVSNVHGLAAGRVALRGKLTRPSLTGGLVIANGTVTLNATGQTIDNLCGTIRMERDTVYVGDRAPPCNRTGETNAITGTSRGPVSLRGTVAVGNWRDPQFDLYLVANGAEVLNNKWGKLRADIGGLALKGSLFSPYLSGQVTVTNGVIFAPEPTGKQIIGPGDPGLFNVLDTTVARHRELFPERPPMFRHLRMEVAVDVRRDTWVQSRDANVEIFTDFPVIVRMNNEVVALTGVVTTDRGEYSFLSKRFQIRRGSAMFIGEPDVINPTLQITGEYEVKVASSPAIPIKVLIGGTLKQPRLALESDAQPPKSQSELLSLLAFGQSSTSLLSIEGSTVAALGSGADLIGLGAGLAVRRLASVAMGVAIDEVENEAGKALGADVLNITPADVPTELWQGRGLSNLLSQTQLEMGKYLNRRTFLGVQTVGRNPGFSMQYRSGKGWRYEASVQPRVLLAEPSLSRQTIRTRQSYGAFILREWRY